MLLTWLWLALFWHGTADGQDLRPVNVDASRTTGDIRSFQGVVGGPLLLRGNGDLNKQYKELRIDIIRADGLFGPVDIDARWSDPTPIVRAVGASADKTIFPNWNADPDAPGSYNFGPTDRYIKAMADDGIAVVYRIGRSFGADSSPPPDFDKYANIVKHVAMHYHAGWAHGFQNAVRYWEFWNEPDVQRNWNPRFVRQFWSGTPDQFYTLYDKVARAIKTVDAKLQVGGPAKAAGDVGGDYREGFIAYCAKNRVPLDFYSWHHYHGESYDPYDMVRIGRTVRHLLDSNGFREAQTFVTEWNMGPGIGAGRAERPQGASAVFAAAAMMYLQDSPVQHSFYYRGEVGPGRLFERDGAWRKPAYALRATGAMLDTLQRLAVTGGDNLGFAVLSGRSADNSKVQVLIANYEIPPQYRGPLPGRARMPRQENISYRKNRGYQLKVTNLPWGDAAFTVRRYRLSDTDNFTPQNLPVGRGVTYELQQELPPPSLDLLVLERQR